MNINLGSLYNKIFNNALEKETPVRVTNLLNGKYLLAKVSNNANY